MCLHIIIITAVEYYYDIDFIDCADQVEIQKRNRVLYESYCNLVSYIHYSHSNNITVYNNWPVV